jgi:hypothetical protein
LPTIATSPCTFLSAIGMTPVLLPMVCLRAELADQFGRDPLSLGSVKVL